METRDEYIPPKALSTLFVSASDESSESKLELWGEDIEVVLSSEDWSEAGVKSQRQTVNSSLKLISYINNSSWSFVVQRREEQCPAHNRPTRTTKPTSWDYVGVYFINSFNTDMTSENLNIKRGVSVGHISQERSITPSLHSAGSSLRTQGSTLLNTVQRRRTRHI